jgi:formylmethanofuran dehydrogenase subunit E
MVLMKYKRPKKLSYREAVRFHGHDGPFLALGYRLGEYLVRELRPKGIMDLTITVKTRVKKPYTCLLDGLQCATFATLGKGNMVIKVVSRGAIVVHAQKGSRLKKYAMTEPAREICFTVRDLQKAARKILRTPVREMWRQLN